MPSETTLKNVFPVLKIKIEENGKKPEYYENNDGLKIFSSQLCVIEPGKIQLVNTSIIMELITENRMDILIEQVTNLTSKSLYILNNPGTIDMDYRGMIKVILWNFGDKPVTIQNGDLIGRISFFKRIKYKLQVKNL